MPRGPAAALAIAFTFGATLAVAIVAAVDVYLHVAPELPGSRLIDIRERITPRYIYLALDGLTVFLFLRTEFYRVAARRARFTLLLAAFGAGVLHIALISALLEAPPLSRPGAAGIALILVGFGFPVLVALWLGRRGDEPR